MSIDKQLEWYESLLNEEDFYIEDAKNKFALDVEKKMSRARVKRVELAEKLGNTPAYITKVLRGDANVTIATMVKVSRALGCDLHFHMVPHRDNVDWIPKITARNTKAKTGALDGPAKKINSERLSKAEAFASSKAVAARFSQLKVGNYAN